jgi:xanthine dehydrogenase accessory factor
MRDLLADLNGALDRGQPCVYCSVVETRGSTPQKAGAAMLVFPDASQRGTLGGGCVEAEVKQRALRVMGGGQPELLTFCLDDDYGWDDGLICGGRMSILAHPLAPGSPAGGEGRPAAAAYFRRYQELVERGRGCTEAVVMANLAPGIPVGNRYLFDAAGSLAAQAGPGPVPEELTGMLVPVQQRPRPAVQRGIALLPILPRITLLIVGGGHVGQYVGKLAAEVDFDVWVLDDRERFASQERFPAAQRRLVGDIGATLKELAEGVLDANFYCIIVTRGHNHDEEALFHLARTPAGYVGMIGSKRKIRLITEDLLARGVPEEALARLHAPLGLDIGSQTVPEIAVSIVAELIACRNLGNQSPRHRGQREENQEPVMNAEKRK